MFHNNFEFPALNKRYLEVVLFLTIFTLGVICVSSIAVAEDEEDDDFKDRAKNLGMVAIGLFSVSILYVFFYQTFINSKKILPKTINLRKGVQRFRKHF